MKTFSPMIEHVSVSEESLEKFLGGLGERLAAISPEETEALLKRCSIKVPVRFFRCL